MSIHAIIFDAGDAIVTRPLIEQAVLDRDIAAIKANIGANASETAYNPGQGLTIDEAVAFASGGEKQA